MEFYMIFRSFEEDVVFLIFTEKITEVREGGAMAEEDLV